MGQKINPISVRIASSTKHFDNAWYSDYFFTKLLTIDIFLYKYVNSFFKFLKLPSVRLSICHLPQSTKLYTFFCYPKYSRESKSKMFHISSSLPQLNVKKQRFFQRNEFSPQVLETLRMSNAPQGKSTNFLQSLTDKILWQQQTLLHKKKLVPVIFKKIATIAENSTDFSSIVKGNFKSIEKNIQPIVSSFLENGESGQKITKGTALPDFWFEKNRNHFWKYFLILQYLKKQNSTLHFLAEKHTDIQADLFFQNSLLILKKDVNYRKLILNTLQKKYIKSSQNFSNILYTLLFQNLVNSKMPSFEKNTNFSANIFKYRNYIENYLSFFYNTNIQFVPFKVQQDWQSASYFADEIIFFLERRISFRQLKSKLLKQVAQNPKIRGIRITCSGRVGGKSKKAQRAKIESIKYGQTSLHVFSSKIDFASRTASTVLGSTGIKVWICYNS